MGLPAPPTSAHIINQHVHQMLSGKPQDSLVRTSRSMKKCADTWDQLPVTQRHGCLPELFRMGLDVTRSYERYYCLCNARWQGSQEYRRCWGCHESRPTDSWHCGTCSRCVHGFKVRCIGCGGASEDFGRENRDKGYWRDVIHRLYTFGGDLTLDRPVRLYDDDSE
jgi:hypothetical protein